MKETEKTQVPAAPGQKADANDPSKNTQENFMQDAAYDEYKVARETRATPITAPVQTSARPEDAVTNMRKRQDPSPAAAAKRPDAKSAKTKHVAAKNRVDKPWRFSLRDRRSQILLGSLAGILVVVVVLALVIPFGAEVPVSSGSGNNLMNEDYDKNAYTIPVEQLVGTILPETADAGVEYIRETLFLGDSNTLRMLSYGDVTHVDMENGIGIESMGITDVLSLKCVQFSGYSNAVTMPEAVAIMQPRRVVITFGTNNVGGMNPDKFIESYVKAVDAIKESYPYADIIVGSIFPIDRYTSYSISMTNIDQYNIALAEMADKHDLKFLNWSEALKNAETGFCETQYTIQDGVHISRDGMQSLFQYFRTHSYITEDTRPKPLADIPERLGTPPGIILGDGTKVEGPYSYASNSRSSASAVSTVAVSISAYDSTNKTTGGGTISVSGQSGASVTVNVVPGGTVPTATATPAAGYTFVRWECSEGSIPSPTSPTLSGLTVFSNTTQTAISVTAVFEATAVSSSAPQSVAPTPTSTPPASAPPASTPPASTPPASTPPASTPPASTPPVSTSVEPPASTVEATP